MSNLKLKGSKNQGFIPITVEARPKTGVTFFDGNSTNNNIVLANVSIKAEIIFVVRPGSVKWAPPWIRRAENSLKYLE